MYLLLGIGISNIAVIEKLKELNKDFILVCKKDEISKAYKYHDCIIEYSKIKYLNLTKIKYVIKSPGIPYYNKWIVFLRKNGLKIINEIELTYILTKRKGKYIGVSGSVGKSSIVSLLYNQISAKTDNVILAGNIGVPLISLMNRINEETIIILELSSFQIDDFMNMHLNIALISNIYDNHLDFYKSRESYYLSKLRIVNFLTPKDYFIVNLDNEIIRKYISKINYNSKLLDYKLGFKITNNQLYYYNNYILDMKLYSLKGNHNLDNLKSVIVILSLLNINFSSEKLLEFKALKYHLDEIVFYDITYVNDSKSTSIDSLKSAIDTYENKSIILIFGGYNKKLNFSFLKKYKFKYLICFGALTNEIESMVDVDIKFSNLKYATMFACSIAEKDDIVLFSPGCASFDEFSSYISRGEAFNKYIEDYYNE